MHLLALGAFWPHASTTWRKHGAKSLNAPFGARCFLAQKEHNNAQHRQHVS